VVGDPAFLPASELVARLRSGEIGSAELLERYLSRIEALNASVNAVVTVDSERARRDAHRADEAVARGEPLGPLHGVPMTIKDSIETEGMRTTSGAPELANHVPVADAPAVARLRAAGAVIFGKTNLPTYAGDVQTFNPLFGTTNNPWDPRRSSGGSSGGAAAAVAAGLTALELGSDIAGSIRNPAHYCGVFGHKPSHGIVPTRGHIPGRPGSLSGHDLTVLGPLARSAHDLELCLDVVAGPLPEEAKGWSLRLPPARASSAAGYRVAAWLDDPFCAIDADVLEVLGPALRTAFPEADEAARPDFGLEESHRVFRTLQRGALSTGFSDEEFAKLQDAAAPPRADERPVTAYARDVTITHRAWLQANEQRARLRAAWADFFTEYDVLVCPVVPTAALPHDQVDPRRITVNGQERPYWDQLVWAGLATVARLPATVVPVGLSKEGLPVGLQVIGPYLEDRTTIDVARRMAHEVAGFRPPPTFL
jgi:amidase